ncbi:MAG: hypothetical protein ABSB80_12035 [Methanoregula sp.]|jgi:hypothetical protein|uniref:hypothetical protein n=1 Tax=Methanoregula sp. TaxID=2052170 RepID=UPI003D14F1C2
MNKKILQVEEIDNLNENEVFIGCSSFEERCLGTIKRLSANYNYSKAFIFIYDKPDLRREEHTQKISEILKSKGSFEIIPASESDPLLSIKTLIRKLNKIKIDSKKITISIDITTFTKKHLTLLLNYLDKNDLFNSTRIFYSEPKEYTSNLYLPMSFGILPIYTITGFVTTQSLNKQNLLAIFLGYEGDRAMALVNNFEPNETILFIPDPPYHPEWKGRTEEMNKNLIEIIGADKVESIDSLNPHLMLEKLERLFGNRGKYDLRKYHCSISPLGTKPQALGLYLFWRQHKGKFSIVYAPPCQHNEAFYSKGIGRTWQLISPE